MGQVGTKEREGESDSGLFRVSVVRAIDVRGSTWKIARQKMFVRPRTLRGSWYVNRIEGEAEEGCFFRKQYAAKTSVNETRQTASFVSGEFSRRLPYS